jgi:hypothetical protein
MSEATEAPVEQHDPGSIDAAVEKLLREPEEVTPESEPEPTAELEEANEAEPEETEESPESDESDLDDEEEEELEEEETETEDVDDSDSEEEPQEETFFTVKVDGEELEVNLEELQSGYQRQKDYTKKTQTLAEERKSLEASKAQSEELQGQLNQQAALVNELLNQELKQYENIDWQALKEKDTVEFLAKQMEMQEVHQKRAALVDGMQKAHELQMQSHAEAYARQAEAERKQMLTDFPEWKDETKMHSHQTQIIEYSRTLGFTDDELRGVRAKDLLVLEKARLFDEMQSKKQAIPQKKTRPVTRKVQKSKGKPAKGTSRKKQVQAAEERFRQSGSLKDAAFFMNELQQRNTIKK